MGNKVIQNSGNNNIALGKSALYNNTSGSNNIALGESSLTYNTSGSNNVALGKSALATNTTGSFNTGLGYNVQSGDFSGSIILGASAIATANGQLTIGSGAHPIGPIATETVTSNRTLLINLNGSIYKILLQKPS